MHGVRVQVRSWKLCGLDWSIGIRRAGLGAYVDEIESRAGTVFSNKF